jgi:hypothetical protein
MSGVELGTIRDLLEHTTTRMTERYAHITPRHLHDAVQRISRTGTGDRIDDEPLRAVASNRAPGREKSECPQWCRVGTSSSGGFGTWACCER